MKIYPCPQCSQTMPGWADPRRVELAVPAVRRGGKSGRFMLEGCRCVEVVRKLLPPYGTADTAEKVIQVWNEEARRLLNTPRGRGDSYSEEHRKIHAERLGIPPLAAA